MTRKGHTKCRLLPEPNGPQASSVLCTQVEVATIHVSKPTPLKHVHTVLLLWVQYQCDRCIQQQHDKVGTTMTQPPLTVNGTYVLCWMTLNGAA